MELNLVPAQYPREGEPFHEWVARIDAYRADAALADKLVVAEALSAWWDRHVEHSTRSER